MTSMATHAVGLSVSGPGLAFGNLQDNLRETVLDLLPAAVYVCDSEGRILMFNRHAAELWGREPSINDDAERYCGAQRMFRLDGGPLPHDECPMADVLRTGVAIRNHEVVIERDDGLRAVALVNINPLRDSTGRIIGAVNCFQDITTRVRAERREPGNALADAPEQQHLEEVRQRLAAVVESSSDAIVSKSLDGIIASWNKGAERIFGYTAGEVIGKSILILIPPENHAEETEILSKLSRGERIEHYETVRRRKDGSLIDISLSISPLYDNCGRVIGASKIARDITEQKKARERQELLSNELQHRTRNIFSVVNSVVTRSFDGKRNVTAAKAAVLQRLHSLSQTHELLIVNEWCGANLRDVVCAELEPYADRVVIEGPSLDLHARAAQDFALAIHELATNAAKYGALSNESGKVIVVWSVADDGGEKRFSFQWREVDGPPVRKSKKRGFGSSVVIRVMAAHGDSPPTIEFAQDGLRYEFSGPLQRIVIAEPQFDPPLFHELA